MNSPDAITIPALKEGKKYIITIEMNDCLYIVKLPLSLFVPFVALAAATIHYPDRWVDKKIMFGGSGGSGFEIRNKKIKDLGKELLNQMGGDWREPIEHLHLRGFARLRLQGECRIELELFRLRELKNADIRDSVKLLKNDLQRISFGPLSKKKGWKLQSFRYWFGGRAEIQVG